MAELNVGQVVDGRYELEQVIGKGGMGCVFRARHVITHGKVAFKVLTDTVDAELQQRFLAEARAASTIGHPAIVAVSDASRTPDGQLYIVMELLAGKPLRDALRAGLPGDQIRRVGLELLDALGAAHRQGIVHRDLKPENIFLLAGTGAVKILDFGIAKVLGAASTSTVTGHVLGTLEYMAPEQLLDAANVDGRADLWAAGIILYELIAGVRPYGGRSREEKYTALATEDPMAIEDVVPVSPDVAAFFKTALARDPNQRFQTAADMSAALRRLSMVPQTSTHTAQTEVGATLGTGAAAWANVPDLRHTVMGARAHPGSLPPPPSGPPQMPAPVATPSTGKKVALAGALLFVAFGIAFAVVMATRKKADDTKVVEGPKDAAVVVKTEPDAPVVVPVTPDAQTVALGSCADHCKRMEACGLRDIDECEAQCAGPGIRRCLDTAKTCEQMSSCYFSARCEGRVFGNQKMTCKEATDCQATHESLALQCEFCIPNYSAATSLFRARMLVCQANASLEARTNAAAGKPQTKTYGLECDRMREECITR